MQSRRKIGENTFHINHRPCYKIESFSETHYRGRSGRNRALFEAADVVSSVNIVVALVQDLN